MGEGYAPGLAGERERPVKGGIAAAENQQPLAGVGIGLPDPVVHGGTFELGGAIDHQPSRLERADATGDHHRARIEAGAGAGHHVEAPPVSLPAQFRNLLAKVELGGERLDLLEQAVDEFLRTADRQRRNVIDRLVRIELRALAARSGERVDDVGLDAKQAQLKDLKQPARAGPNDDDVGDHRCARRGARFGHALPLYLIPAPFYTAGRSCSGSPGLLGLGHGGTTGETR